MDYQKLQERLSTLSETLDVKKLQADSNWYALVIVTHAERLSGPEAEVRIYHKDKCWNAAGTGVLTVPSTSVESALKELKEFDTSRYDELSDENASDSRYLLNFHSAFGGKFRAAGVGIHGKMSDWDLSNKKDYQVIKAASLSELRKKAGAALTAYLL